MIPDIDYSIPLREQFDGVYAPFPDRPDIEVFHGPDLEEFLADRKWRLYNLYMIIGKDSTLQVFRPNWCQEQLLFDPRPRKMVLKGRQIGISTGIQADMFDDACWNDNHYNGILADTTLHGKSLFYRKIMLMYTNLPEAIRHQFPLKRGTQDQIVFDHGSQIEVSANFASTTLAYLHNTEYGLMARDSETKAQRFRTGTLPALPVTAKVIVETTSEGPGGSHEKWWNQCQEVQKEIAEGGRKRSPYDIVPYFFGSYRHHENRDPTPIDISAEMALYFNDVEKETGDVLDTDFKYWYIRQKETYGDDIYQQYPNTLREPWMVSNTSSIFGEYLTKARAAGRVMELPHIVGRSVHLFLDLGRNDMTAMWFMQQDGPWYNFLQCYANNRLHVQYYLAFLEEMRKERGYSYGRIYLPHDSSARYLPAPGSTLEAFLDAGYDVVRVERPKEKLDVIEPTRRVLESQCRFDAAGCEDGLRALLMYSWKRDPHSGLLLHTPHHKWSDYADAFQTFGAAHARGEFGGGLESESVIPAHLQRRPAEVYDLDYGYGQHETPGHVL